ncbi:MAG TPA: hypothetical protein VMU50_00905 [Polyangia bacterium]|nr:hypothetical protein [Polyangia bacterium]
MLTYLIYVCSLLNGEGDGAGSGRRVFNLARVRDPEGGAVVWRRQEPSEAAMPQIAPKGRIAVGLSHGISFQH